MPENFNVSVACVKNIQSCCIVTQHEPPVPMELLGKINIVNLLALVLIHSNLYCKMKTIRSETISLVFKREASTTKQHFGYTGLS